MSKRNGLHIDSVGSKFHYKDGTPHRIGGPAVEWETGNISWWLYGKCYRKSDYDKLVSNLPLLYWERFKVGNWI